MTSPRLNEFSKLTLLFIQRKAVEEIKRADFFITEYEKMLEQDENFSVQIHKEEIVKSDMLTLVCQCQNAIDIKSTENKVLSN